ncbi:MAG: sugar ABC transporter ATP-binding protein [Anaerolineales bacterium]|nr:sugar ABC transporter ATP-binding protein [Anaerolineales bacterium]
MRGVSKAFPGVQALDNVDFEVYPGEVVALLGENGAGKSTLMKILSGAYHMDQGEIRLRGEQVTPQNPHHAQKLGISIIYQEFNLTPNQSVATNIFLGREPKEQGPGRLFQFVDRNYMRREAVKLLAQVGARFSPDALVRNLSVAEQQMVEIAKALAEKAEVIIMDEPTSALGEEEVVVLFDIIKSLKEQGLAIIFITHRMEEVFRVTDRIIIFRDGRRVGGMPIGEATTEKIIALMVGRPLEEVFQHSDGQKGDVVLEVRGLTRRGVIEDVSFALRRGEILGLAGLVGAGRTETVRAIFGADPLDAGEILIDGKRINIDSPETAVRAGLALVPESRQIQGLMLIHSVERNIAVPNLDWLFPNRLVDQQKTRALGQQYVDRLNIRTPGLAQKVMFLSGGNQQKVVLAKWLATNPKVLILDEPTRGIDVGAKAEVHGIMNNLALQGIGIIMISSEMPEVLAMSDRIVVMCEGRVSGILDRAEATQERIMAYASGHVAEQV